MRHKNLGITIAAVIIAAFITAPKLAQAQREYPEWYSWEYDEGIYLTHDVEHHLDMARDDFERRDMGHAAEQILIASDYMKLELGRATNTEEKQALAASIQELEQVANGVVTGKVRSVDELNTAFAHANYALATHHLWKAQEAVKRNEPEAANKELKAASYHLERSMAYSSKPAPPAGGASAKAEAQALPESGYPAVDNKVSATIALDIAYHLNLALEDFQKKDMKASAEEIRMTVALLKLEGSRTAGETQKAVVKSIGELETLADAAEKGALNVNSAQLASAFARVDLILAKRDYDTAAQDWRNKRPQDVGYSLHAAAFLLDNAAELLGKKDEKTVRYVINNTEPVAAKLIKGGKARAADVNKIIKNGTKSVEKLNKFGTPMK